MKTPTSKFFVAAALTIIEVARADAPIPDEASRLIKDVHQAAKNRDFKTLRSLMADEFTWSFGGDASKEKAVDEWTRDPSALNALYMTTKPACGFIQKNLIQCPLKLATDYDYRAGFMRTPAGWKMIYFVAGD